MVCFRYRPAALPEPELDDINRRLGEALLDDGRVVAGATVYGGRAALRPAISNWRTTADDLDLLVEVVRSWAPERPTPTASPPVDPGRGHPSPGGPWPEAHWRPAVPGSGAADW